jgi:hypothetical protein
MTVLVLVYLYIIFTASFVVTHLSGDSFAYHCTYHVWTYYRCNTQLLYLTLDCTSAILIAMVV